MKSIYLIAIVFVASCSVISANDSEEFDIENTYEKVEESCENEWDRTVPHKCPDYDPLNTTVHLAHETDCEKFYMCLAGEKIERICALRNNKGDRLHFNERCQVCDWPEKAKCHQHATTTETDDSGVPTENSSDSTDNSSESTENSSDSNIPESTPNSSEDWEDCSDKEDGTLLPHECGICELFYLCRNGDKIAKKCPKDRYFSTRYQGCVYKDDSNCPDDIGKCKEDGDQLPHECICEYYYECNSNGDKVRKECPKGLHFNPKEKKCQDPKDAGCKEPPPPPPPNKCPKGKEDGDKWPHECDCRLFYKCVNGEKQLRQCEWGKWFDDVTNTCRPKKDVDCKNDWQKYKL